MIQLLRRQIAGELLKLKRVTELIVVLVIIFTFLLLMFFQKGFNNTSGYFTPELITVQYMSSFNLLLLVLLGFIPGAFIGAYISGTEYKHNTNVYTITNLGRIHSVIVKVLTLFLVIFCLVLSMVVLGIIEGLIVNRQSFTFNWQLLISQILSSVIILSGFSLIGFLGAFITQRVYGGILIAMILPILLDQLSGYLPVAQYFTLSHYTSSLIGNSFYNLNNDPQIQYYNLSSLSYESSLLISLLIILFMLFIYSFVNLKRDFKA